MVICSEPAMERAGTGGVFGPVPPSGLPSRDDVLNAVQESLASTAEPPLAMSPGNHAHLASLAHSIHARLDAGGRPAPRDPAAAVTPLPLNLCGIGHVAYVGRCGSRPDCVAVEPVAPGHFVFGSDNEIFGRWDALVSAGAKPGCSIFPAHGGEIIPGTIEEHVARIRQNLIEGTHLPVQVDIDCSMACPSSCSFCFSAGYRATRKTGRMMHTELLLQIIQQYAQLGVRVVRFDGGGDPLTHPGLLRAIDRCRRLDLRTAVLSAGDLLGPRHIPAFVRARTYVRISLNAASDETRLLLHGQNDLGSRYGISHILDAVSLLADARNEQLGAGARTEMPIGATSMIHPANVGETVSIAIRAKNAGFDHLSFRVILGKDHRVPFSAAARAELDAAFREICQRVATPDFQVFTPTRDVSDQGYVPSRYFRRCRASTHRALVEVGPAPERAAIVPCGRYRGHGYRPGSDPARVVFGYLDGATDVADVWLQPPMRQLLASFPHRCGDCIDRSANLFLESVEKILRADLAARFFPFSTASHPDSGRYA